jgi:ABC-type phosphonate transport system ATPase subunit
MPDIRLVVATSVMLWLGHASIADATQANTRRDLGAKAKMESRRALTTSWGLMHSKGDDLRHQCRHENEYRSNFLGKGAALLDEMEMYEKRKYLLMPFSWTSS